MLLSDLNIAIINHITFSCSSSSYNTYKIIFNEEDYYNILKQYVYNFSEEDIALYRNECNYTLPYSNYNIRIVFLNSLGSNLDCRGYRVEKGFIGIKSFMFNHVKVLTAVERMIKDIIE